MQKIIDFFFNFDCSDIIASITILTINDLTEFWNYFIMTFQLENYFSAYNTF